MQVAWNWHAAFKLYETCISLHAQARCMLQHSVQRTCTLCKHNGSCIHSTRSIRVACSLHAAFKVRVTCKPFHASWRARMLHGPRATIIPCNASCKLLLRASGGWHVTNLQLEGHPCSFRKVCTQACHSQLRASLQLETAGNIECTRVIVDVPCKLHGSDRSDHHPNLDPNPRRLLVTVLSNTRSCWGLKNALYRSPNFGKSGKSPGRCAWKTSRSLWLEIL